MGCEDEQSPLPNFKIKNVALKLYTSRYLYGVTGTNFPFQHTGCFRWNLSHIVRILLMLNYNGITKKPKYAVLSPQYSGQHRCTFKEMRLRFPV